MSNITLDEFRMSTPWRFADKDQIIPESELDIKYREYILHGISEGEAAYERGEYLESAEARKYLLEQMK